MREDIDKGLDKVLAMPTGRVSAELGAGTSTLTGPFVFGELDAHPWTRVGLYAKGQAGPGESSIVAGIRGTWDFM